MVLLLVREAENLVVFGQIHSRWRHAKRLDNRIDQVVVMQQISQPMSPCCALQVAVRAQVGGSQIVQESGGRSVLS